jgi:hypothetical protein
MNMKVKFLLMMLLVVAGLSACSSDDGVETTGTRVGGEIQKVRTGEYTELWTVTIEPEYVLNGDFWGGYTPILPAMEAVDGQGNRTATFLMGEIKDFDFEEGYRYTLQVEAEDVLSPLQAQGIYLADASRYEFTLKEVIDKEYVGIREDGRRDVEMDVQLARVRSVNAIDSWEYVLLCGTVVGTGEKIYMSPLEIFGLPNHWIFQEASEDGSTTDYSVRMKVSITPSDKPVYGDIYRRIRLQEIVSKEKVENINIIYMDRDEAERILFR